MSFGPCRQTTPRAQRDLSGAPVSACVLVVWRLKRLSGSGFASWHRGCSRALGVQHEHRMCEHASSATEAARAWTRVRLRVRRGSCGLGCVVGDGLRGGGGEEVVVVRALLTVRLAVGIIELVEAVMLDDTVKHRLDRLTGLVDQPVLDEGLHHTTAPPG